MKNWRGLFWSPAGAEGSNGERVVLSASRSFCGMKGLESSEMVVRGCSRVWMHCCFSSMEG